MTLRKNTLEKLRELINEAPDYRSGPKLVSFFNDLGGNDRYERGFPSRWVYTDGKLADLNGTSDLDRCIKKLFDPSSFIGRLEVLDSTIRDFNQYLAFDGWVVERDNAEILFKKASKVELPGPSFTTTITEDQFLSLEFRDVSVEKLKLSVRLQEVLEERIEEIRKCLAANAPLSIIFLAGSTLEGILLGMTSHYPKEFNQAASSPKKDNKVKPFHEWTLNNLIEVAFELDLIKDDVRRFSHTLRDFRNFIHPHQQSLTRFSPDIHTAKISWQVLKAAVHQLKAAINKN